MTILYTVCDTLQKEEIDEYCFKKCGKIVVGGILFNGLYWSPCYTKDCLFLDREEKMGKVNLNTWGEQELTLRKLKPLTPQAERGLPNL